MIEDETLLLQCSLAQAEMKKAEEDWYKCHEDFKKADRVRKKADSDRKKTIAAKQEASERWIAAHRDWYETRYGKN